MGSSKFIPAKAICCWALISLLLCTVLMSGCNGNDVSNENDEKLLGRHSLPGLLEKMDKSRVIHAGYGDYPPYSVEDPRTGAVTGFSIDVVEEIAKPLKCEIVWHKISWDTMSADLKRGAYDFIASPIFQTIPRAPEFAFSEPYIFFADGIGVVRKGDTRFSSFQDLDKKGVKIAVGLGQASEALVRARFKVAEIVPIRVATDNMLIFNGVVTGRVDVAVADLPNAMRFVREHPEQVEALWVDNPPSFMPAGFALRPDDTRGAEFLTVCIRYLKATGIMDDIARKYGLSLFTKIR